MFNKYPNHQDAGTFLKVFEPLFKYETYSEASYEGYKNYVTTKYIAKTNDGWEVVLDFYSQKIGHVLKKQYYPSLSFKKDMKYVDNVVMNDWKAKSETIADHLQKTYTPDFERMINVLEIFIEQGLHSGMFKQVDLKNYKKAINNHLAFNNYHGSISLNDRNFGTVTFNQVFQKGTGRLNQHFKKSLININVIFLAQSDNTIQPYFKIKLPYSDKNKITCVIPLSGEDKVYLMGCDDYLRYSHIDKMISSPINKELLQDSFNNGFQEEIKTLISKTLKMKKAEVDKLTAEELKEYLVLVEMIKI